MAANAQQPGDGADLSAQIDQRPVDKVALEDLQNFLSAAKELESFSKRRKFLIAWADRVLDAGKAAELDHMRLPIPWKFWDILDVIGRPYCWGTGSVTDWRIVAQRCDATHPVRGEQADLIRLPGDEGGGSTGRSRK